MKKKSPTRQGTHKFERADAKSKGPGQSRRSRIKGAVLKTSHKQNKAAPKHTKPKIQPKRAGKKPSKQSILKSMPKAINYFSPKDAIIKSIILSGSGNTTSEDSIILTKIISSISEGPEETYRNGMAAGKIVYASIFGNERPKWYEDSIPKLVEFLEKAGYNVKYNAFEPNGPQIYMDFGHQLYIGMPMHIFEAGLMTGFFSAAKGAYTPMHEEECMYNGGETCRFVSGRQPNVYNGWQSAAARFAGASNQYASSGTLKFSSLYNSIIIPQHMSQEEYKKVAELGRQFFKKLGNSSQTYQSPNALANLIKRFVASENVCVKGSSIKIEFAAWNSTSSYINSVKSFIEGLLGGHCTIRCELSTSGLAYSLSLNLSKNLKV